ncbi:MAG: hypothetical protein M1825_000699 [Sarcosagium campestre]|nr:MAG: hypothetical protein M1825_000699 [Sarcosagium campestre]
MPPLIQLGRPLSTSCLACRRIIRSIQASPCRRAASGNASPTSKPRVLEKPTKFTPPSHPARLPRRAPVNYPGPRLSATAQEIQKTKQYPHMMPAEGTFLHWFITNRKIHVYITLGSLFSLASFTFVTNFQRTSPFAHMLPPGGDVFRHPISFVSDYIEVFKLHTAAISAETADRRKRKVDDVQKRNQYRKAHGLDGEQGLGGWTAKSNDELLGPALPSKIPRHEPADAVAPGQSDKTADAYTDWEGRKKPLKKWLGIW